MKDDRQPPSGEELEESGPMGKLRQSLRREVEELVDLELDVEDLAQRKASLLREYLKADVGELRHFWDDLKEEVLEWEGYLGQWMLQAADPTQLDWIRLDHYIDKGEGRLMAGEVAIDQELLCVGCGRLKVVEGMATIQPCNQCGSELFTVREKKDRK